MTFILKGVRRVKGGAVKQKLRITIDLLLKIFLTLNVEPLCKPNFYVFLY